MNIREAIESFHLLFSHRLTNKVDRSLFCLKGGCNLRFFFRSIRYSEDIDFDVQTISVNTLKKNVSQIIEDSRFHSVLSNQLKLSIVDWSAPKQTETTQRWKVALRLEGQSLTIPTKIEFYRRQSQIIDAKVDPIATEIIQSYRLQPIILQHYKIEQAVQQKIQALIHRTETQARDIIDLQILKNYQIQQLKLNISKEDQEKAIETLMAVRFDDFKSQVWPYLLTDYQNAYDTHKEWNRLQQEVIEFIENVNQGDV
jgi:predicted nucleotidyltransferase component of viral defense system